jgi:putative ABC transport system substrate-binding protein
LIQFLIPNGVGFFDPAWFDAAMVLANLAYRGYMRRREFISALVSLAAWPPSARAQQPATPIVGYLNSTSPAAAAPLVAAFQAGLGETGYVEGRNVRIEFRWAEGQYDRLPELASDLVRQKVDVIATSGGDRSAIEAKSATQTIPIVSVIGGDPVAAGLVTNLARPGGNLTGVSFLTTELMPKRLDLLAELIHGATQVALLVNPNNPQSDGVKKSMSDAARLKGVQLHLLEASRESEIDSAFDALAGLHIGALVVAADPFYNSRAHQLVELTSRHAVPAIYEWRGIAEAGGLISYGASLTGVYRQVGTYVGKILSGKKVADLPVLQPTKFELVVNLKTAKALGVMVPASLLVAADEVIE